MLFQMPLALVPSPVEAIVVSAKERYPPIWNDLKNTGFGAFKLVVLQIRK